MLMLQINPLEMTGPQFLKFYVILMIVAAIVARLLKRALVSPRWTDSRHINLDPYEAAYLRGGARQAIDAAIAMLAQRQLLKVSKTAHSVSTTGPLPAGAHWFERAVHQAISPSSARQINDIRSSPLLTPHTDRLAAQLKQWGLIPDDSRWQMARTVSGLLMLAVLGLGVAKIFVGVVRHRPVGFLVFLCIVTGIITLVVINSRPARTRLGEQALAQLRGESAALQMAARTRPELLASGDVALAIGLFGVEALAFTNDSWTDLRAALRPPPSTSSGASSSSCGSSCSSSSCGSSCGGGCGGGCGGCGGG
ncbi:MAG TPA: TIGR04222 domain-containing membrane protein [Blastocatellia bacterium]|nr:TIGR04222 domain-containing membrane protein [Blastocatellia bacterium]